jgi:hypothetical protein
MEAILHGAAIFLLFMVGVLGGYEVRYLRASVIIALIFIFTGTLWRVLKLKSRRYPVEGSVSKAPSQ